MNKRTGEFLGGGALGGTLIGALAGGGKGLPLERLLEAQPEPELRYSHGERRSVFRRKRT